MKINLRPVLWGAVLCSFLLVAGCETSKGAAVGIGATAVGVGAGAAKDSQNLWQAILKVDEWIKKNLW